jgi:hypothetical protein
MSWHCSRVLVEAFSVGTCSDGGASAPSNTTPTPDQYYWPDKTTEHSRLSRFGMTCEPLTADRGAALLTWFLEASRAKTSAQLQETGPQESTGSVADCGPTWRASLAKFDRDTFSWKTAQFSLLGGLAAYLQTWPSWGSMRNGESLERITPALPTSESASGFWPTPSASDTANRQVSDSLHTTKTGSLKHRGKDGTLSQIRLSQVVKFRTPNASDAAKWSHQTEAERVAKGQQVRLCHQLGAGGQMNPQWVEWLMGWPLGWTDLKPLATAKFQEWRQQHGAC